MIRRVLLCRCLALLLVFDAAGAGSLVRAQEVEATPTPTVETAMAQGENVLSLDLEATDGRSTSTVRLTVQPISYLPPLSVEDCIALSQRLTRHLDHVPDRVDPGSIDPSAFRMVDSLRAYLRSRDEQYSSPLDYEWSFISKGRVSRDGPDVDVFEFPEAIDRVSVLGFEAEDGDIVIHQVKVYDESGAIIAGFRGEHDNRWLVQAYYPRRDLFHLWRRATISKIEVRYEAADPAAHTDPRLIINVGKSNIREYGKMAIFHAGEAKDALSVGDIAAARKALTELHKNAADFRNELRRSGDQ
jgi:hypothetical protein